jgi:hypothetical protein
LGWLLGPFGPSCPVVARSRRAVHARNQIKPLEYLTICSVLS